MINGGGICYRLKQRKQMETKIPQTKQDAFAQLDAMLSEKEDGRGEQQVIYACESSFLAVPQ